MRTRTFFQRKHDKKVDLKAIERSTVSTLLIPKHLVEKLDLVLPVVLDTTTMKKSYPALFKMCYCTKGVGWKKTLHPQDFTLSTVEKRPKKPQRVQTNSHLKQIPILRSTPTMSKEIKEILPHQLIIYFLK